MQQRMNPKRPTGEDVPDPAGKALDEPHLPAADLQREIGDSENWDEASMVIENAGPEAED